MCLSFITSSCRRLLTTCTCTLHRRIIAKLQSSNTAKRIELDWMGQLDALNDARRLVKHHMEVLRPFLHEFVLAAVPSIDQLRSSTVKVSMLLFQEMFSQLGRGMDKELDEIVPTLAKRAGEVSTAGAWLGVHEASAVHAAWVALCQLCAVCYCCPLKGPNG